MPPVASILGRAAAWPPAYVHRLPDAAFLHIEAAPGAAKDASGRTTPRSLRHLPILDADGHLDLPHLRDAMAQLPHAGPWLPPETRDALIAKAKALHTAALSSTHKAAKGLPDWSLGYLSHLDRHEALGVGRDDAHRAWPGDAMLGKRAIDLLKGLKRAASPVTKAAASSPELLATLRRKVADFNARAGERPGTKVTVKALAEVHDRGTAAYDAAARPVVKSRDQWGAGRANAFLRLTASGKPDHPGYTADNDLLPAGHPRATRKAAAPAKPGAVVRPKPPAPPPEPPPPQPSPAPKPKAKGSGGSPPGAKPPRGKAPLPAKAKPVEAEKAVDTAVLGEEVSRTGGTPWPDVDMGYLAAQSVYDQLDSASSYAQRGALLPTDASGDIGPVDWRLPGSAPVAKDELGAGDLDASGKLAPEQGVIGGDLPGFERRTWQGIPVVLDRPKGTRQTGIGKDGQAWERVYQNDYGYVPATLGGDGEELDLFLGPDPATPVAYVAIQQDDEGDFDELKVMLGFPDEAAARACYVAHIPERYLARLYAVPVALLQGMLGLEPEAVAKAAAPPRRSFIIEQGKVRVRWPTTMWSSPAFDPEPTPAGDPASSAKPAAPPQDTSPPSPPAAPVASAAPALPMSGAAPEAAASFTMALDPDELEAAAKAARAVQAMLPAGPSRSIGKIPPAGEAEKGMDGGALLYSPPDPWDDPEALTGFLHGYQGPWLVEQADTPRTRRELAKAGTVFVHKDVPGSIFAASYVPAGVDVLDPHPDAGDDEATTWKAKAATTPGPDADVPVHAKPPGATSSPDPDRGVPPALVDGAVVKAQATEHIIVLNTGPDGVRAITRILAAMKRTGDVGHGAVFAYEDGGYLYQCAYFDGDGPDQLKDVTIDGKPLEVAPEEYIWNNKSIVPVGKTIGAEEAERIVARATGRWPTAKAYDFVAIGKDADGKPREERYVLGPVLIPDRVDLQGDVVAAAEIQKSEQAWMERYQNLGLQHGADPAKIDDFRESMGGLLDPGKAVLVESYLVRDDRGGVVINGRPMPNGTWLMAVIYKDDALWAEIKAGKRTGFSIGGFAKRVPLDEAGGAPR